MTQIIPFISAVSFCIPPKYPKTLQLCKDRVTIIRASKTRNPSEVIFKVVEGQEKSVDERTALVVTGYPKKKLSMIYYKNWVESIDEKNICSRRKDKK